MRFLQIAYRTVRPGLRTGGTGSAYFPNHQVPPAGSSRSSSVLHLTFNHHHSIHRMIKSFQFFSYECGSSRSLVEPSARGCERAVQGSAYFPNHQVPRAVHRTVHLLHLTFNHHHSIHRMIKFFQFFLL